MPKYTAGWNMPGHLCESEPIVTDDWSTARNYIVAELDRIIGDPDESDWVVSEAKVTRAAFTAASDGSEIEREYVNRYVYWLVLADNPPEVFDSSNRDDWRFIPE